MSDKEQSVQLIRQLLACQENDRLEIERLSLRASAKLLECSETSAFESFQRALIAYNAGAFSRWQSGLADVAHLLEGTSGSAAGLHGIP